MVPALLFEAEFKIVHIDIAASLLRGIVEDGKFVARKVIHAENHVEGRTEWRKLLPVGAVGEVCGVCREVAIHTQPYFCCSNGQSNLDVSSVAHLQQIAVLLLYDCQSSWLGTESKESCVVARLHVTDVHSYGALTAWPHRALGKGVACFEKIADNLARMQTKVS